MRHGRYFYTREKGRGDECKSVLANPGFDAPRELLTGFTLVELIVGLALTLAALMLFSSVVSTIPLTKTARNQNIAYHIASKKIEELRNTAFASLPASGNFSDSGLSDLASSTASLLVSDYQGSEDIKEIKVTITWLQEAENKSAAVETLIYNGGINQK